ncbi:MAG: RNA polymerase sigma-54 factor [Omnitrophica bacterium GWA2_52_8]|nr:MAG: RNA polymerase sigma-54 factor [Omnitrophica bacterium GWA2_52_8]
MDPRLIQSQSQKLILSPQIRQYLRLLQLPIYELQQEIDSELMANPLLEERSASVDEETPGELPGEIRRAPEEIRPGESYDHLADLQTAYEEDPSYRTAGQGDGADLQRKKNFQDSLITRSEGLSEYLMWQARFLEIPESAKRIAEEIIGNIDEHGYLSASMADIAAAVQAPESEVLKVLKAVQTLDPPGIGARNLQEALLIQLDRKGPEAALARVIVADHLPLLEKRNWPALARILAVSESETLAASKIIARLEPHPGRTFYSDAPIAVTPDASVYFTDEEPPKLKIDIHDESLPELRVNPYYRRLLRNPDTDAKTREYIREKIQAALNFLKAMSLRKSTLREITEQIVKTQSEFFEKGFSHLRPLRLRDVADVIGIHESTVSRAIQGKHIATPRGLISYKSFFSPKLETNTGESESQKSIMEKIRSMIGDEPPQKPLSDQEIVKRLQNSGIVIARRTVAKYRDLLKILPSHLRRKRGA